MYKNTNRRLKNHNYACNAYYFITICTHHKQCFFGQIQNTKLVHNKLGNFAYKQWNMQIQRYPHFISHNIIIMPNHIHAIIEIDDTKNKDNSNIKTLSQFIALYKSFVCQYIHKEGVKSFQWQRSFYDHIIRNEYDYIRIIEYIENNPLKWTEDRFYSYC